MDGSTQEAPRNPITKQDFFEWGLSGGPDSAEKRKKLLKRLDLPERMTANALLQAVNLFCGREELEDILRELG